MGIIIFLRGGDERVKDMEVKRAEKGGKGLQTTA
jgi:hypothetical protein